MQTVTDNYLSVKARTQVHLRFLGDQNHENFVIPLRLAGYGIGAHPFPPPQIAPLCALAENADAILIDVSAQPRSIVTTLDLLISAIGIGSVRPRVLCFSTIQRSPQFVSALQKCGIRYTRVDGPAMLLEAIELLLWELNALEHYGPVFRVTHRYSQGTCAPGEEAAAIEVLSNNGDYQNLSLAITERLIFEALSQHQLIALDSLQIVSIISGEWFFRDHAANSGRRQIIRLRRPTVKVSVERIRKALALVFEKAKLPFNPYDVLRSCPAVGTNRVLYRLQGRVDWYHPHLKR